MGEVFRALEVLNDTMELGLTSRHILRAEIAFKSSFAQQGNPSAVAGLPTDPVALAEGYELVTSLQPRAKTLSLSQLSSYAKEAVASDESRIDADVLSKINQALGDP